MNQSAAPRRSFNPALDGTPEEQWRISLSTATDWVPEAGPLLVVSPHPDDEVLGAGGLIRMSQSCGRAVTVLSVTDGEAAYPDWHELGRIRQLELDAALRLLVPAQVSLVRLGIPDGKVSEHVVTLFSALDRLADSHSTIVAPYEFDGHPDHDITGGVCREVGRNHGLPVARYPIWTWHHGVPHDIAHYPWRRVCLDADAQRVKAAAIQCFASQLRPASRTAIVPRHVLPYFARPFETFLV